MHTVDVLDATEHLPDLIERALRGEAVIITRDGQPLVQVTRLASPAPARRLGFLAGQITVPEDFDRMGEKEIERLFGDGA